MAMRIQRKRSKGWRMPEGTVYVGRPGLFGNPWLIGDPHGLFDADVSYLNLPIPVTPHLAAEQYSAWLEGYAINKDMMPSSLTREGRRAIWDELVRKRAKIFANLARIKGKDLACWCPLDQPCHADVLLKIANGGD
jgi:hypothetical protein